MTSQPWNRFYPPIFQALTALGATLPGATLSFFASNSSNPQAIYADSGLTVPLSNPVIADASGYFPSIFLQALPYKVVFAGPAAAPYFGAQIWTADPVEPGGPPTGASSGRFLVMQAVFDGNQSALVAPILGDDYFPASSTIIASVLQADVAGTIQIDVWVKPFVASSPPTVANTIVASDPPTLTAQQSIIDTTLTGWAVARTAGDAIRWKLTNAATCTRVTHSLICSVP